MPRETEGDREDKRRGEVEFGHPRDVENIFADDPAARVAEVEEDEVHDPRIDYSALRNDSNWDRRVADREDTGRIEYKVDEIDRSPKNEQRWTDSLQAKLRGYEKALLSARAWVSDEKVKRLQMEAALADSRLEVEKVRSWLLHARSEGHNVPEGVTVRCFVEWLEAQQRGENDA
jgi:hypothetical protein